MRLPQVVIVGRPNVGKSSIFNWLIGRRVAIVDPQAGVTRDRVTHLLEVRDRFVELVDTGGMGIEDTDNLTQAVEQQIEVAIDTASVILFVVDVRAGITPLDEWVAKRLRYVNVPVLCVANKTDVESLEAQAGEFYRLRRKVVPVSAAHSRGREQLLEEIYQLLPPVAQGVEPVEPEMKLAIVGRRNVGKSTFVNTLAQAERMIVSEVPGTTRDSVDVRFELDGKVFVAIDTPGFRRRKSVSTSIDFYSMHRAQRSIRQADVVLLFFDCTEQITKLDKQLADYIARHYKPMIFVVNKWDLVDRQIAPEKWVSYLRDNFRFMWYAPIAFISGKTGKNVKWLLDYTLQLYQQAGERLPTAELNRLLCEAIERNPPPLSGTIRPKIYYATQVGERPPTIVMFCNEPKALSPPYQRYLLGALRERAPYREVPIKLYFRKRSRYDRTNHIDARLRISQKETDVA